jgi:hypothetical protein
MATFEFHGLPRDIVVLSVVVLLAGLLFIVASAFLNRWRKRREAGQKQVPLAAVIFTDILRDIGIAFVVAIVVTIVYEESTRGIFEGAKMQQVLKTVLSYDVPNSVWAELNDYVLHRPVIRRKASVVFRVEKDPSFYGNLARLRMDYSYYLYSFGASSIVPVRHDVVGHMIFRDYPRFEHASVTEPGKEPDTYDRARLEREGKLKSFQKEFYLEPGYNFSADAYDDTRAARVQTVRDEVVSLPGAYPLGIPEIVEGPVEVTVQVPEGVEPEMDAQWGQHAFGLVSKQPLPGDYTEYKYSFSGTLLPGQTILVLFKVPNSPMPPTPHERAEPTRPGPAPAGRP